MRPVGQNETTDKIFESDYITLGLLKAYGAKVLTIKAMFYDDVFNPNTRQSEEKLIATLEETDKKLIVGTTLADDIVKVAGTNKPAEWPGTKIRVFIGSYNNRPATRVERPKQQSPTPQQQEVQQEQNGDERPFTPEQLKTHLAKVSKYLAEKHGGYTPIEDSHITALQVVLRNVAQLGSSTGDKLEMLAMQFVSIVFGEDFDYKMEDIQSVFYWATGSTVIDMAKPVSGIAIKEMEAAIKEWGIELGEADNQLPLEPDKTPDDEIPF